MNSKTLFTLLILTLLSSCGSFEKEKGSLLTKTEHKDLVNVFDINKDQADLFKEKEINTETAKTAEVKATEVKTSKKSKNKKGSKIEDAKSATAAAATKSIQATHSATAGFNYPADYPQILKDYDNVSKSIWDKFKPMFFPGEQSIMAISYLGVTAGYITISSKDIVKLGDKTTFHYFARFKSKDAYRYFYWLDDTIETFVEKNQFLPVKYSLIQREKKQNVDDLELFDFKKLKTFHWYKRVKEGNNKDQKIENYISRFTQDSFSALQFVRGLPLQKGDLYDFPVVTRGEPWLLKIEVMGEETISVNGTDIKAFRLKAETHFPGVLQKSGDINFWYSADETRKLVKFQAKVKIGSIYGELVEYKPGVLIK
ncbi:MAG: DUF3108 domain-containing protein [Bacteriovorax sp.]|nr:DUF3108 domain-containing protein [Bacteriovorax sp.]